MHHSLIFNFRIVTKLLGTFRDNINILYKSSEAIALLDMLLSLATSNISSDYSELYQPFIQEKLTKSIL